MKVNDQVVYDNWKKNNQSSDYGMGVFRFVERWADKMEKAIEDGFILENVASSLSQEADTEGITGFQYGCAISILAQCWEYGERLRKWHNIDSQIGTEGEKANTNGGVLNPALLRLE